MKKLLVGLFLISSIVAFSDVQTVPYEKIVTRGDSNIVYIEGQQAPFTGVVEKKYPNTYTGYIDIHPEWFPKYD